MDFGRTIKRGTMAVTAASLGAWAFSAVAHHSSRGIYDGNEITEVRGYVEEISWSNPHVRFKIRGLSDDGREALWDVEGASVSMLGRRGISRDVLKVGDSIRVAGNPSVRGLTEMYVTNFLLPDGREVLTLPRVEPRWTRNAVELSNWTFSEEKVREAVASARGIFRVWSMPSGGLWNSEYPLTEEVQAIRAQWNPADSPYISCIKGMPSIMEQPYPMEFVEREDGNIELRIEEYDVVRVIEMDPEAVIDDRPPDTFGHSVGRWESDTLVVTTSRIGWPYFDQTGIPLNETTVLVERFTPVDDGARLDYRVTVTDPQLFSEPVVLQRAWNWNPGEEVKPFNCVPPRRDE